jgi:hypothetical protein
MKLKYTALLSMITAVAGALSVARAEVFTYTDGNLILGFQATAGQGTSQNVFFNLGKATDFRNNGSQGVLGNIGATLTATYGAGWYDRTDLWFGVIANLNQQPNPTAIGSRAPVEGDPSRTFYLSTPAAAPGAGLLIASATYPPDILGIAGNALRGLEQVLTPTADGTGWNLASANEAERGIMREADGSGVLSLAIPQHATAWNNSWTKWNPTPGAAFSVFTGGIQQNFGKGGSATYVDVQRVLATNTGAVPTGVVGGGTYETTISISAAGVITSLIASPASPFSSWIGGFNPPLTNSADREATADPDNDGTENLLEFVLNGNPSSPDTAILPVLGTSGADFVFSFTRRADSASEVSQVFEYSTNLVDWTTNTPVTIPNTPGASGVVTVGASTGTAPNQVQAVTITIPKGTNTQLFGRLKVVK